uniref:Uncharacterized protein n=1 Tax=Helianthus annuus TaxID=4232 RepID=A0A251SBQ2_HELAN
MKKRNIKRTFRAMTSDDDKAGHHLSSAHKQGWPKKGLHHHPSISNFLSFQNCSIPVV